LIQAVERPGKPLVLVVEDDATIQAMLRAVLVEECEVQCVGRGAEALNFAGISDPDLILLDVGLPDMDGLEVCRQLKAMPRLAPVPVIFLTSQSSPDAEVEGLTAGGIDYITKPVNPPILKARVHNHIELKRSRDALERMARLDGLTGLANRRTFDDMMAREWRRLARVGHPLSVIMMDVDNFKQFNDTYGHAEGDVCLQQVARAAAGALQRPADVVARYGGEEFIALLPDTTLVGAIAVAEAIRAAVSGLKIPHAGSTCADHVTLSLGVASAVPQPDGVPKPLIEAADEQLYAAKSAGRNRVMAA
jgi:diguanylate cyclase (GGDEF)-like protein